MSILTDYMDWYSKLQAAVQDALNGPLQDGLKQEIRKQAKAKVYDAYSGGGYRRGKIGAAENLEGNVNGYDLHIRNVTVQQGGPAYQTETGFVEEGAPEFRQPFPREFMQPALEEYAYGQAGDDLANALRARGFVVE